MGGRARLTGRGAEHCPGPARRWGGAAAQHFRPNRTSPHHDAGHDRRGSSAIGRPDRRPDAAARPLLFRGFDAGNAGRLSRDALEAAPGQVTGSADVDRNLSLIVQVIPKTNVEVIGDDRFEMPP
jgi:hypothetical protein